MAVVASDLGAMMRGEEVTAVSTTPDQQPVPHPDDFVPTEELVRRQGVRPITSVEELAAAEDPFGSDQEYAEFLADLYASRRSELA